MSTIERALVTGGCGFLGSSIVKALLTRGVEVRILALPGEKTDNVDGLDVEIVRGDVTNPPDCVSAVRGMDTVFHAAAIYKAHMPDPTLMYEVNMHGTFHMLEACRHQEVERVVYTASIVSLGRAGSGRVGDEGTPYEAWDLDFAYSRSKYHSRELAEDFAKWGLDVRIVCPAVVFGPGDITPTPSGKLIIESLKGGPPVTMEGGTSYVDVRDAAEVHVLAAEKGAPGERYVAVGHNLSNEEFGQAIGRALGRERKLYKLPIGLTRRLLKLMNAAAEKQGKPPVLPQAMFEYSTKPSFFSNDKTVRELGATYRPIEETIRDAAAYFRDQGMV